MKLSHTKLFPKPLLIIHYSLFIILASCQISPPLRLVQSGYLGFDEAIHQLSQNLMIGLQNRQDLLSRLTTTKTLVFNPFIDVDSGQVMQASLEMETRFLQEVHNHFKNFQVTQHARENLDTADYVVNGIIKYEANPHSQTEKYYHITASIIDLHTKTVIAQESVGMKSQDLNYHPTPSYEDNPMFVKDRPLQEFINMVNSPVGTKIAPFSYQFIQTKSLIVQAQTAYNQGDYKQALRLFQEALQRPDGKIIETYGGLYTTNYRLGHLKVAENHFSQMVAVGVESGNLPMKLLFEPNLTEFLNNPELRKQYALWIRQLSLYFQHSDKCVNIIGHTSKYGQDKLNKFLSERRAQAILDQMYQIFSGIVGRSKITGKGADETIVGTAPDSAENAIDRRVEFKIIECSNL